MVSRRSVLFIVAWTISLGALMVLPARAQAPAHVVVDQTGLPLPGAHIEVRRADSVVYSTDTGMDGGFNLPAGIVDTDLVDISLDGFETVHLPPAETHRVVLQLAHATESTTVVASALTTAGASMEHLGSTMVAPLAQRLPTPRPRITQSLPLLPAVVRARDGQLNIGGTKPHESTLWIDGFDVTDPVRGSTSIDLPVESVRGMAVLREAVAATFTDLIGSAASIETNPGSDRFKAGLQGFIPRPRLSSLGFGQIEAFFPRFYAGGRAGITRFFVSTELNYERVPVPGVTGASGRPYVGTTGVTNFVRFDLQPSTRNSLTAEVLYAPAHTSSAGLSTLRPEATVPDVDVWDFFVGLADRLVLTSRDLLTLRLGIASHHTAYVPQGEGNPLLTPEGWRRNWFSAVDVTGQRAVLSATWERTGMRARGNHDFSTVARLYRRSMSGALADLPITVVDPDGRPVRIVEFGKAGQLNPTEYNFGFGVRDLWDLNSRVQLDLGFRLDGGLEQPTAPGPRAGVRVLLDSAGRTTFRASVGRYVGRVPLAAKAYGGFPVRTETYLDPNDGRVTGKYIYTPALDSLPLPRATAIALEIEHRLTPTLEVQAAIRHRHGSHLPTLDVPLQGGFTTLAGTGESNYKELQFVVKKALPKNSQMFVSYVWSKSIGESNDFGTIFTNLDTPLLDRNKLATNPADVPHRLRGWATFSLPSRIVVSPALDWRTGFPYSALDVTQHYISEPNLLRYPIYLSADVTIFKTFEIFGREMDLGLQFFNITAHENPRDVIAVVASPHFGEFSSTFGVTLAGYMQIRW